ncbi:MAG: efflux RND transporter periplasmic adaptor subunit [Gemmatimonadota bacterium]
MLIAGIREGDAAEVAFEAVPGRTFEARVTAVSVSSAALATTFPVTVQLGRPEPDCRPGMVAEVTFRSGRPGQAALLVPSAAVAEDRQGRFVYLVEPDTGGRATVRRRVVEVGGLVGESLEITAGLNEGDRVVTAGVSRLVDGQTVRLPGAG